MKTLMKYVVIALMCFPFIGLSQDTLYTKDGEVIACTIKSYDDNVVRITSKSNETFLIPISRLTRVTGIDAPLVRGVNLNIKANAQPDKYYGKGGKLLIAGSTMFVVAGALSAIGIVIDVPELAYAGAGCSGVGIALFIGSGSQFIKGSKKVKEAVAF